MGFDPYNRSLNIRKSIKTPIPKMETHLGVWRFIPSHSPTLSGTWNMTLELHFWPAPSQALALVVSAKLGLWQCVEIYGYKRNYPQNIMLTNGN
jgi:hypothetical protein